MTFLNDLNFVFALNPFKNVSSVIESTLELGCQWRVCNVKGEIETVVLMRDAFLHVLAHAGQVDL